MARVAQYVTTRLAADYDNDVGHGPSPHNGTALHLATTRSRAPPVAHATPRRHREPPASPWSSRSETRPATSAGSSNRSPKTSTKSSSSTATPPTSPSSPPSRLPPRHPRRTQQGAGKGSALRTGFLAATGDVIVMMDADGSMSPQEIRHYLHFLANGYDFVKGSRFISGGGSLDITPFRRLGNWFLLTALQHRLRRSPHRPVLRILRLPPPLPRPSPTHRHRL